MIHTSEVNFLSRIRGALGVHILFGGIATLLHPAELLIPYTILSLWAIAKYLYCAHITESFTEYASFWLNALVSFSLLTTFLMNDALLYFQFKVPLSQASLIASIPSLSLLALYYWAYSRKSYKSPFCHDRYRVKTIPIDNSPSPQYRNFLVGASAGACALAAPLIIQYDWALTVLAAGYYGLILWIIFYYRNTISGVKRLKTEESAANKYFLFENIEAIRELRQSSWISRRVQKLFN